jgi:hypothetical protein
MITEKRCQGPCGLVKPLDDYPRHNKARDGHLRFCTACCKQYGMNARPGKRRQERPALQWAAAPVTASPVITPLFIQAGAYRFALASIALVDLSQPGRVDLRMNIHEVNGKGFPEALSFTFEGADAALLLAALDGCTGQADGEIEALRATVRQLESERDLALQMADELEQQQKRLRAALGVS